MKTSIDAPNPNLVDAMQAFGAELDRMSKAKTDEVAHLEATAKQALGGIEPSVAWRAMQEKRLGPESEMLKLLDEIPSIDLGRLFGMKREASSLLGVTLSFAKLTEVLGRQRGSEITKGSARILERGQTEILDRIDRLRRALESAGDSEATRAFPWAQLDAIQKAAEANLERIHRHADRNTERKLVESVRIGQVEKPEDAARVIGQRLGDAKLGEDLLAIHAGLGGKAKAELAANLSAMALLADEAVNAPDYAMTKMGWHHPRARSHYRMRWHDNVSRYQSEDRQNASEVSLREALQRVVGSKNPGKELELTLVGSFLAEVGVTKDQAAEWKPNAAAIRRALEHEAFVPMRGLNETKKDMSPSPALSGEVEKAVSSILRHIVEGDYREWRYDNVVSAHQLEGLDPGQLAKWKKSEKTAYEYNAHNVKLTTREEDDIELLWLTKIGGPSHGFDYGGHCLLPLLSNGRTKAILVDHDMWPHNAAARSYIRLLHTEDGRPTLYLEPFQRDFPHREKGLPAQQLDLHLYAAVILHAKKKADAMGLPLSIGSDYGDIVRALGIGAEIVEKPLLLRASNGVFEASDTLGLGHDFHQQVDMPTPPLTRLEYRPA